MASTTTNLNDLLPSIVQEALFVASERSIMRGLVKNYTLPAQSGKTVNVPIYPLQTAVGLTEGTAAGSGTGLVDVSTNTAQLVVSEVGLATQISDLARLSSATNVVADIGRLFGEAIARKMDLDLTAKFVDFTTNVVGSANIAAISGAITAADVFKAVAKLRQSGVPSNDIVCVLAPSVAYDLKANLTNTFANPNAGLVQNQAMSEGFLGMLAGVSVYETANLANNGTTGDYVGGVFHRDALGLAMMQDIRIETQRNALLRGDDLVASAIYGVGVLYEGYGVAMSFDSSVL
jgi:N4-gp56 family major capsid protein